MINYRLLADSQAFYDRKGYKVIEAPWLVTRAISDITKPKGCSSYAVTKESKEAEKVFVASGEQSFLYLINKGHMPEAGCFQTITPCMRDDAFDETHTKYFMKNELIVYGKIDAPMALILIDEVINDAMTFFLSCVHKGSDLEIKKLNDDCLSKDIYYKGVEIGSYGFRKCAFTSWVYGTGLAEPRFSRLLGEKK